MGEVQKIRTACRNCHGGCGVIAHVKDGKVIKRATFTVLHNGVLVQDHVRLSGGTGWDGPHSAGQYKAHADKLPFSLQDHGNPVRFRNVWLRELED